MCVASWEDDFSTATEPVRMRVRGKTGMTVHEVYNRDRGRRAARWCKRMFRRFNRRAWRQSIQQGFGGETPTFHGHW